MNPLPHIALQYEYIDPQKRKWHPYEITFDSPDGNFCFHIYAISDMHAAMQLEAIKETGRINGQTLEAYPE